MDKLSKGVRQKFNAASKVETSEVRGHRTHVIDPNNPRSIALLSKAYEDIYQPAFPMADEQESLEKWLKLLTTNNPSVSLVIIVTGQDLDADNSVIKGISVAYYYHAADVSLLAYNAISPEYRDEGLGRTMIEARQNALLDLAKKNGGTLKGVFLECNDPEKVNPEDCSFDPVKRIKVFEKWGARKIPIDYVQPALEKGAHKCEVLQLMAYPHPESGAYPDADAVKGFIHSIFSELAQYSGNIPQEDADYIRIMKQIDALKAQSKPVQKPPTP